MKKYFILFSLIILFIACEKDSNPLEPVSINDKIIGIWKKTDWQTLCFYKDFTFTDSTFLFTSLEDTTPKLVHVANGEYSIDGDILKYNKFHFTYIYSNNGSGIMALPFSKKINFSGRSLILTSMEILELVEGKGNELWGTWSLTKYMCHSLNNPLRTIYNGRRKETYTFLKDTSLVEIKIEYPDDESREPYEYYSEYSYNPPDLFINAFSYEIQKMEIKNSKMYWYFYSRDYSKVE